MDISRIQTMKVSGDAFVC